MTFSRGKSVMGNRSSVISNGRSFAPSPSPLIPKRDTKFLISQATQNQKGLKPPTSRSFKAPAWLKVVENQNIGSPFKSPGLSLYGSTHLASGREDNPCIQHPNPQKTLQLGTIIDFWVISYHVRSNTYDMRRLGRGTRPNIGIC